MKTCVECGQTVQDNDTYCPRCGGGKLRAEGQQGNKKQKVDATKKQVPEQVQKTEPGKGKSTIDLMGVEPTKTKKGFGMFSKKPKDTAGAAVGIAPKKESIATGVNQVNNGFDSGSRVTEGNGYGNSYNTDEVVSIGEFIIFYLLCMIPFYNIFLMIKTAIGGPKTKQSLTNLIRASLIFSLVGAVLSIILMIVIKVVIK